MPRDKKMGFLERLPWIQTSLQLNVDYTKEPLLPKGAVSLLRHNQIGSGAMVIAPGELKLREMPRGYTYANYHQVHAAKDLCDVQVLDAIIDAILQKKKVEKVINKLFGKFSGQVFFLGTSFRSVDGKECVPFLNINTHFPALRYICPAEHPINHDVCCCACFYQPR